MSPTSKFVSRALLVMAAVAFVGSAAVGFHRWIATRDWVSLESLPTSASSPSSLATLVAMKANSGLGDLVFLNDVKVEPGPKAGIFIVRGAQGNRMLVVTDDQKGARGFSKADVRGQIRKLPPWATLRKEWRLSKEQALHLSHDHIYIAAEYIKPQAESADAK